MKYKQVYMNFWDIKDINLGIEYSKNKTTFRTYSPDREKLSVVIYDDPDAMERKEFDMTKDKMGFWECTVEGDLNLKYYNYLVDEKYEVTDPYSISSSINSKRSVVVDLEMTNPKGFLDHEVPVNNPQDAIIYETHVKDFTYNKSSGVREKFRGKFLGISEDNTSYEGFETGLSHIRDLGITHLHLMPIYDFLTVDENNEAFNNPNNYNWGYDPELYNTPEGSYSVDSKNPISRIKEFKELVMACHKNGISVVMDVVYNHTFRSLDSNFNVLAPSCYYRINQDGTFSNGSGCGNEFASEKAIARKFIIDSLKYWVREYKVDGFRFDLMALIDRETVDIIVSELRKLNQNILIYGEPWMAWDSTLPINNRTLPGSQKERKFSIFNSRFRDAIKGDNDTDVKGYIQGEFHLKKEIQIGIMGSITSLDGYEGLTKYPYESINYFNSHDNLILADKLKKSTLKEDMKYFININKMAFNIILLSFGLPFFHAGNEFLRSKNMDHNSYRSPITVNQIDWSLKKENYELYSHVRNLIHLRRKYCRYMLKSYDEMADSFYFINELLDSVIGYTILGEDGMLSILHNSGREKFVLEHNNLENHISYYYKDIKVKDIELIFDEEAKSKGRIDLEEDIVIPPVTTYVLKLRC
ncbi:type I pullulanase [Lagierella massiliensis]|uniref:type I pullulanase n=1 Tax=Lagierella massiliensis TaxID=1689303 RepID=UPI001E579BD6|nr:type I pullulanase [Lagierella massiliensis]